MQQVIKPLIAFLMLCLLLACGTNPAKTNKHLFFLHNRFLETHDLNASHPSYGKVEYEAIIQAFENEGLKVWSEKRQGNTDTQDYARKVVLEINKLINTGIAPGDITVIGTSKGGYIAQYVSTFLANPQVNFIFVACFRDSDIENFPEINFCGNILTIYERSDPFGISAVKRKETTSLSINHFKEVELQTGLNHGFLFKPLKEWIGPSVQWTKGDYE